MRLQPIFCSLTLFGAWLRSILDASYANSSRIIGVGDNWLLKFISEYVAGGIALDIEKCLVSKGKRLHVHQVFEVTLSVQ